MIRNKCIFVGLIMATVLTGGGWGASNGCDKAGADYINPALALCSTHVYNVGQAENLSNPSDRQVMQEVIATKTTIITQQIYKQYEYLNATIRRLKTQLEKAVLTTSLQAAGATDASGGTTSSASRTADKNVVLMGAENCLLKNDTNAVLSCIQNNIQIVLNAVAAGNYSDAKRQMDKNLEFAVRTSAIKESGGKYQLANGGSFDECNNMGFNRDSVSNCAYTLKIQIMDAIEKRAQANQAALKGS